MRTSQPGGKPAMRGLGSLCVAGLAIVGALSACTDREAAPPGTVARAAQGPACYQQTSDGAWSPADGETSEARCFALDSCSGGLSESGGGCYKWAENATATVQWSIDPDPPLAPDVPPPMRDGINEHDACPTENCTLGPWRAKQDTAIHARIDPRSQVVATIPTGEWVVAERGVVRRMPNRGVVLQTANGLAAGDVVYLWDQEGDVKFSVWRRGDIVGGLRDELIRWDGGRLLSMNPKAGWYDDDPNARDPGLGWWVLVKRANGQRGWVRDPEAIDNFHSCRTAEVGTPECAVR